MFLVYICDTKNWVQMSVGSQARWGVVKLCPDPEELSESSAGEGMLSTQARPGLTQVYVSQPKNRVLRNHATSNLLIWLIHVEGPVPCFTSSLVLFSPVPVTQTIKSNLSISINKVSSDTVNFSWSLIPIVPCSSVPLHPEAIIAQRPLRQGTYRLQSTQNSITMWGGAVLRDYCYSTLELTDSGYFIL